MADKMLKMIGAVVKKAPMAKAPAAKVPAKKPNPGVALMKRLRGTEQR